MKVAQQIKIAVFSSIIATMGSTTALADNYAVDTAHGQVGFKVKHMVISKVKGHFDTFSGTLTVEEGKLTSLNGEIDVNSVNTANEKRDAHLINEDFFDSKKFPSITFKSTAIDGETITGQFTLHGVTKEIKIPYELNGPVKDPWGNTRVGIEAEVKINRNDYGLTWSKTLETGGLVVGNDVEIELNFEAIKQ